MIPISEIAELYRQIIIRAVISVGLAVALCLGLLAIGVAVIVHAVRSRRASHREPLAEYDEAA